MKVQRKARLCVSLTFVILFIFVSSSFAQPSNLYNFDSRRPVIIDTSSHIELTSFEFGNVRGDRSRLEFQSHLSWTNIGEQPVVAFEIVMLKYDPFNRPLIGTRMIVPGHTSGNWSRLRPGESDSDGSISSGAEDVFTGVAYIRHVRLLDGTVWSADLERLHQQIQQRLPDLFELGEIDPGASLDLR